MTKKEVKKNNEQIEKALKDDRKKMTQELKLLLLGILRTSLFSPQIGAGESGKSTIAKQMKILHLKGYDDEEKAAFSRVIHKNILECIKSLISASKTLGISLESQNEA
jgi:guanine nucleotide-binding protein G(i) subunit alpha